MAHFNPVIHTASGALASSGIQREREGRPSAKQRRLSRPNTSEEIRRKRLRRRQRQREEERKTSKKEKRVKKSKIVTRKVFVETERIRKELDEQSNYAKEQRKRAIFFWKKWREDRRSEQDESQVRQVDRKNITSMSKYDILGTGRFGCCKKEFYRGNVVAVKYYHDNHQSSREAVHKEAASINYLDHPGLPYIYGVCTTNKPYLMVMEFYGINGKSVTIAQAARTNMLLEEKKWADLLLHCSKAIEYLHENNYIHCDLKGDNIVFNDVDGQYFPIIIDFGKMKKVGDVRVKKLSSKEQEQYRRHHRHIAPEVVRGTHPPSTASDIYAFGLIISLVCHNNTFEELRLIAVQCIKGSPLKRLSIDQMITSLSMICV